MLALENKALNFIWLYSAFIALNNSLSSLVLPFSLSIITDSKAIPSLELVSTPFSMNSSFAFPKILRASLIFFFSSLCESNFFEFSVPITPSNSKDMVVSAIICCFSFATASLES